MLHADKHKWMVNREIAWLSFNHRVLQEADDPSVPLIERIRFLGIFSNNLDEFFKVRVASIKRMIDLHINPLKITGDKPKNVLEQIQTLVIELQKQFGEVYDKILGELEKENIFIINEKKLNKKQGEFVRQYFQENIHPVLSVVLCKNLPEFPYMKDRSIYLAVKMFYTKKKPDVDYAVIEIPSDSLSRFLVLPVEEGKNYVILIDDVIRYCLGDIFSLFDYDVYEAYTIKLTRDAELDMDNDMSKSLLEKIAKGLLSRSQGQPVRFIFDNQMPDDLLQFIIQRMGFDKYDNIIPGGRYHNFRDFIKFPNLGRNDLEYEKITPLQHKDFASTDSLLDAIDKKDILLHYPYHDFLHYINLLREVSIDPDVKSIKTTIYRVAEDSKVVNSLLNAARNGKKVTVNIELQARFDEATNIRWSKQLSEVGAKVLFGISGLKVHAKLLLITRVKNKKAVDYACIATGNFHEGTAKVYSDMALFTSDKRITKEVRRVFDLLEYSYRNYSFTHLLVSPITTRKRFIKLIDKEIANAKAGKEAYIIIKVNSLVDYDVIHKLYYASNAGVQLKIIVRGMCSMNTEYSELKHSIEAISIVDKYLEHSRVFMFCNGGDELVFIGSADLMTRNLDTRIEVVCPIYDTTLKKEIKDYINMQLNDNIKARVINLGQDNMYKRSNPEKKVRSQVDFYRYLKNKVS